MVWVALAQFAFAGLVALAIMALSTAIASRRVGEREAITDARITTLIRAQGIVEPLVTEAVMAGDRAALVALDDVVRERVLDRSLVRVKLWTADGVVVYSDEPRLVGGRFALGEDERDAMRTGRIEAEVSDLDGEENRFEQSQGKLLEVYLPIQGPAGEPLLFEAYYRYDLVEANGRQLWRSFAPIALGALVLLELAQLPLAWSLARQLRDRLREGERLAQQALDASEHERRRIARDLHDGVVQDLAGASYSLSALSRGGGPVSAAELAAPEEVVRQSIAALRSLLVDLYPPDLAEVGLGSALTDLLGKAEDSGLETHLDVTCFVDPVPDPVAAVLYRVAQEALRNVVAHAAATRVDVRLATEDRCVRMTVRDDGRGLDTAAAARAEGHVGLRTMGDLVRGVGGAFGVSAAPGEGTTVRVEVPL